MEELQVRHFVSENLHGGEKNLSYRRKDEHFVNQNPWSLSVTFDL